MKPGIFHDMPVSMPHGVGVHSLVPDPLAPLRFCSRCNHHAVFLHYLIYTIVSYIMILLQVLCNTHYSYRLLFIGAGHQPCLSFCNAVFGSAHWPAHIPGLLILPKACASGETFRSFASWIPKCLFHSFGLCIVYLHLKVFLACFFVIGVA